MKRTFVLAMSILLVPPFALGQTTEKETRRMEDKEAKLQEEIKLLEARRLRAMVEVDTAALDRILADDLTYTHSSGQVDTKAQFIASLKSGQLKYESVITDEVKVRVDGDGAVVTGRGMMKVKAGDRELNMPIRFTDVYVKRGGRWQMVAWQSTRIAQP